MTVVHDLPDADYHSRPELSSTGARLLLPEFGGSPAKFKYRQGREYHSAAFDVGKAVHAQVLGVGAQAVAYPEDVLASNGAASTKAAKDWADSVRFEGKIPMKAADLRPITGMSEAVLKHPTARALFELPGHREVSVFSEVDGVKVRARFDALTDETPQGVFGIDLKTSSDSADGDTFTKTVVKYGYHVQQEFYKDAYRPHGEIQFVFVVVETTAPYLVAVHRLGVMYEEMGRTLADVARKTYAACEAANTWPGHPEDVQTLEPPVWAAMAHEERYALSSEIRI
jgi:exodeoxyribonuclease VIII